VDAVTSVPFMEGDHSLLKSIVIETLIPEDGSTPLSDLLEDGSSSEVRSETIIVDVTKRDLLFIGMPTRPWHFHRSYSWVIQMKK
jgi:hypothetical protein